MNKLKVLKEANENPNARVVTSEQAAAIVKSLQEGTPSRKLEDF
jgi:hypothetical protein